MAKISEVIKEIERIAPLSLQESYDNAGLITGNRGTEIHGVLISLDCTEDVIDEAIEKKANLVIAHHPILFKGLKKLTGENYVERTLIKAIKHDIAIYAIHTNLDNVVVGVNNKFAEKLGLVNIEILKPINNLQKIVTFVPQEDTIKILDAIHSTGAGEIGEYSECSFRVTGTGRFTASDMANPTIGNKNMTEEVTEDRVELIFPSFLKTEVTRKLLDAHPYEEPAYYISDLDNSNSSFGAGVIGDLPAKLSTQEFLAHLKKSMNLEVIKYTKFNKEVKRVALCGGAGSFLLSTAIGRKADVFVTGDVKYHEYFDAEDKILFCDIGHYESEVATKELLHDLLTKKFTNFALHLSGCVTNPIKYYK